MVLADEADIQPARSILDHVAIGEVTVDETARILNAAVTGGPAALKDVLNRVTDANIQVIDIGLRRPTLDDVFLSLTGHAAEEVAEEDGETSGDTDKRGRAREKEAVR